MTCWLIRLVVRNFSSAYKNFLWLRDKLNFFFLIIVIIMLLIIIIITSSSSSHDHHCCHYQHHYHHHRLDLFQSLLTNTKEPLGFDFHNMLQDASIILNFVHHQISTAEWRPCLGFCKQVLCILYVSLSCSITSYMTFPLENSFSKEDVVHWMADVGQVTVSSVLRRLLLCDHQPHYHFYSWSLTQLEP